MKLRLILLGAFLVVLAGCTSLPATSQGTKQSGTAEANASPTNLPLGDVRPTVRPDLEASDSASFKLAAGKLQLIEFFAYW